MPEAVAVQENQGGGNAPWLNQVLKSVGIFLLVQTGVKMLPTIMSKINGTPMPSVNPASNNASSGALSNTPVGGAIQGNQSPSPVMLNPMWPENTLMDMSMYISPSYGISPFNKWPSDSLVLNEKDMRLGDWNLNREISTSFSVPSEVQNNGTLWAHFFVAISGSQMDPTAKDYDAATAYHFARPLTQYFLKKKVTKKRNLLSSNNEEADAVEDDQSAERMVVSYYHPNFTLSVVPNSGTQALGQLHPAVRGHLEIARIGTGEDLGEKGWYYPTIYLNTFWQLRSHMTEINSTVSRLPLNIHLNSLSSWKFNLMAAMDFSMKQNAQKAAAGESLTGGGDGSEMEEIKRVLLDSNVYLLTTTVIVSIFHMIFEMLAFKSDVSHWRNKKDNVGVSVRTILANVFMQLVIFLYLIDNTENTSWMILFGQGMGILVEAWKITKSVDVRVRRTPADSTHWFWSFLPYTIVFEDKHKLSDTEKKTQEYDEIAFRYLYIVAVPLLLAYAAYSLMYDSHKSWYSFIIATLVGSVYAYGFLMMVPSLYINYRLQSVAHLPARAMTYKFLNTFIDDLFAFTIKMPMLHRLATLRDDVIFFAYLYQSYKYKVDYNRVNEFGQGGDEEELKDKLAAEPLEAPAGGRTEGMEEMKALVPKDGTAAGKADVKAIVDAVVGESSGYSKGAGGKWRKK